MFLCPRDRSGGQVDPSEAGPPRAAKGNDGDSGRFRSQCGEAPVSVFPFGAARDPAASRSEKDFQVLPPSALLQTAPCPPAYSTEPDPDAMEKTAWASSRTAGFQLRPPSVVRKTPSA